MAERDYSQEGDPYGITAEYTSQSAVESAAGRMTSGSVDVRGNTLLKPRTLPTQDEADAIAKGLISPIAKEGR